MKMYVFPADAENSSDNSFLNRPVVNPAIDVAIVKLCAFLLAWSAGAGAAALIAIGS